VFYAIFNFRTGVVNYCNAGHNPPHLLHKNGTVSELPLSKNTILGVFDNLTYLEDELQLEQGDTLVMFTDGVTEATNVNFDEFGDERLDNILCQQTNASCQQIIQAVKAGIKDFVGEAEQSDDITMLVVKRK
jgi:sigma-B regulation protein RsbU (phosphoserine phosphatase)